MSNGGVQIETEEQDIGFDGERIVIYGSEVYRNVTCGMCGDFDGEKVCSNIILRLIASPLQYQRTNFFVIIIF